MKKILYIGLLVSGLFLVFSCAQQNHKASQDKGPHLASKFLELTMTCEDDPVLTQVRRELSERESVLDLMLYYMKELEENADPDSPYLKRLDRLFECGRTPEKMQGYFYGITLVLKMGDQPYGDFLNRLWSRTLADVSPWAGKMFSPISPEDLEYYTGGYESAAIPTFFGINCFKKYDESFLNLASIQVLNFWLRLEQGSKEEKRLYGCDKKGGLFIARKTATVNTTKDREQVFQLNYRWKNLGNPPPIRFLVDEMVEIADGLYLGRLLLATQHLFEDFDPQRPDSYYGYENFGYFLLLNQSWHEVQQ